jgi:hypothetical protein
MKGTGALLLCFMDASKSILLEFLSVSHFCELSLYKSKNTIKAHSFDKNKTILDFYLTASVMNGSNSIQALPLMRRIVKQNFYFRP